VIACIRFGSSREAVETSDVDLLVAPGPDTTLFDLSGFALDVEEIVGRHVDVATPHGLKARIRDRVLAEAVACERRP
jgi:predicted nucleotidyltransferase